ncbi:hypothetical protein SAMN05444363_2557 [Flavobacterium terrae]|uniref:Uncharacterized protein n=1 Tax=Flavobacterium terrae TaxID=415425 RepID=A0A1M6GDV7_9FLAO|nr:hypothetical protein SAMN05444363_2557 [Flavobacterium terrae]
MDSKITSPGLLHPYTKHQNKDENIIKPIDTT